MYLDPQYFHSLVLLQNGIIRLDHVLLQKNYLPLSIFSKDRKKGAISFWTLAWAFFAVLTGIVQFLLWRLVAAVYFLWFLLQTRFLWFLRWRIRIANKKPQELDFSGSEFTIVLLSSTTFLSSSINSIANFNSNVFLSWLVNTHANTLLSLYISKVTGAYFSRRTYIHTALTFHD